MSDTFLQPDTGSGRDVRWMGEHLNRRHKVSVNTREAGKRYVIRCFTCAEIRQGDVPADERWTLTPGGVFAITKRPHARLAIIEDRFPREYMGTWKHGEPER